MLVKRNNQCGRGHRGVTIVELLIVVGILTILAAVALPTVRTIMNERKTSQAALLVKNYFEAARARAIARGRPVAVVLERLSSRAIRNPDPNKAGELISVVASDTDLIGNFGVYNTCIRLSMAEQPSPFLIERGGVVQATDAKGDPLEATIDIYADDARLTMLQEGVELEFPDLSGIDRRFRVERIIQPPNAPPTINGFPAVRVVIDNFGGSGSPYGSRVDAALIVRLDKRKVLRPYAPLGIFLPISVTAGCTDCGTRLRVYPTPKPTSVQVLDLPRGTCIDLSLSGMASAVPLENRGTPEFRSRRDTRRMFASNWSYTDPTAPPTPQDLRPVYLVFGTSGTLERVIMNDFGVVNPLTGEMTNAVSGSPELETYEAIEDVFLFVGRTDQVIDAMTSADILPETLENESLEANLNDGTANWVRVSPSSGAIAVAPAALVTDGFVGTPVPIGQLLMQSRKLSFTDTETAQ